MRARTLVGVLFLAALAFASAQTAQAQANPDTTPQADAARTLTDAQRQAIKTIQTEAERRAAPAVLRLNGIMSKVYANMLAERPDARLRATLSARMEKATWALFAIKGQSVYEILRVLTPAQRQLIRVEMKKPGAPMDVWEIVAHLFKLDDK
jgi:hypothetical protein